MSRISFVFYAQISWIICLLLLLPSGAQAFDANEHPVLGDYAVATLRNDGFGYLADALQAEDQDGVSMQHWFEAGGHDADLNDLSKDHYYDPVGGLGLWGFNTALAECNGFYADAVTHWENGDVAGAAYLLGQSVHLVQDMAIPFHVHLDPLNGHSAYEAWAKNRTSDFSVMSGGNYSLSSPGEYVRALALISYGYYGSVTTANATEASYMAAVKVLEPLAIRMSAGMVHMFFSEVEWQAPVLSAAKAGISSAALYWTPSAEPNFVRYDVYMSSAGKDVVRDDAHKISSVSEREGNAFNTSSLTSYGQYQFQVVTVLANGSLVSEVLTMKLGVSQYLAIGAMVGISVVAVVIGIMVVGRDAGRKTKRR